MQGQRGTVVSMPETLEFDCGSASGNSTADQQICWNNVNPAENQIPDYILSPCDMNSSYDNSIINHEWQNLSGWSLGEPSSSNTPNEINNNEQKRELGWSSTITAGALAGPSLEERRLEPTNALSLDNVNTGPIYICSPNSHLMSQNLNLNAGLADSGSDDSQHLELPNLNKSSGSANECIPPNVGSGSFLLPSGNNAFLVEDTDGRPSCSLDTRRVSCKRKAVEGNNGQSSDAGSSSYSQHTDGSAWHTIPTQDNAGSSSRRSIPSEEVNARLGLGIGDEASENVSDSNTAGCSESFHRNFRLRLNPSNVLFQILIFCWHTKAMASDSSPPNFNNGPSSPDDSLSSPIGNTFSSPASRRRRRSSTPSAFATPSERRSRFASSDATPTAPRSRQRSGGGRVPATSTSTTDDVPASSDGGDGFDMDDARPTFVWGTNISVEDVNDAIKRFLRNFRDASSSQGGDNDDGLHLHTEGKYEKLIRQVIEVEGDSLDVDARDVFDHDPDLYTKMVRYPLEVLAIFDLVLMNMVGELKPMFEKHIQTRIFNLRNSTSMRNLNPSDIERMVSLKGMVIRSSSIIPEIREAIFRCLVCGFCSEPVPVERGRITEPTICLKEECQSRNSMTLVHNRCRFADKQIVRVQETPDEIPEGGTPHTVSLLMHDKLVDTAKPGDRVEVTGIYRAMSVRIGPTQRTVKSLFKTYIDCLHIKKTDKSRMLVEDAMDVDGQDKNAEVLFDEEKVAQLKELSKRPDIYEILTKSMAPNIWELDDVKKGLLCQLFGGNALKLASGANFRGDINILLVGDPGTSKSQLLQYIHKLSPRGIYTSGRGSSAVGLTAYVTKDPETGETVLESGALVLSDRGICCIDEFDKMSDNARSMLHEVMEQQTVSIAKAGIIASLNARTSVLACANPSGSRYNPRLSVIDNIHLPPTLLSRFDLIYLMLDKADEQTDRRLAKHIVSLHFENPENVEQDVLDISTLTDYVSYARKHIHPQLSDEAAEELTRGYVEIRKRGNFPGSSKKVITATPRQIESLIRLSEALARMRFSEWVEKHDVMEAFRLLEVAMQQSATDHSTGTIDMDLITTGVSASERMRRESLQQATRNIIMEKMQIGGPSMRLLELLEELKKQDTGSEVHLNDLRNAIATLATEGFVTMHGDIVKRS